MTVEASAAEPAWPEDAIEVGRILDAYGIKGWIKVQPFSSDPQALYASRRWFLAPPENNPAMQRTLPRSLRITQSRDQGDLVVASAEHLADRNAAEALRGARVFVSRSSFPAAGLDEFYWIDLIGLDVLNRAGESLGQVVGLIDTGPHSVLRVQGASAGEGAEKPEERLIPFVGAYVDDVSLAERRITVDWGLDY